MDLSTSGGLPRRDSRHQLSTTPPSLPPRLAINANVDLAAILSGSGNDSLLARTYVRPVMLFNYRLLEALSEMDRPSYFVPGEERKTSRETMQHRYPLQMPCPAPHNGHNHLAPPFGHTDGD